MKTVEEIAVAAKAACDAHDADIFIYSGGVEDEAYGQLAAAVTVGSTDRETCILILATNGGSANAAYRIARFFQRTYKEFLVYAPGMCKSAGTLLAMGANGLILDHFSELGPLDVQISKQDELGARKSGLLARSTFEALAEQTFTSYEHLMYGIKIKSLGQISFRLASELAADMAAKTMGQIYSQLNPESIGTERRNLEIARQYGNRLVAVSQNMKSSHTVDHFVSCYPSHDFVIDDNEARKWFERVELPSEELYKLVGAIGDPAYNEQDDLLILSLNNLSQDEEDEAGDEENTADNDQGTDPDAGGAEAVDERGPGDSGGDPGEGTAGEGGASPVRNPVKVRARTVQTDR